MLSLMAALKRYVAQQHTVTDVMGESTSALTVEQRIYVNRIPRKHVKDNPMPFNPPKSLVLRMAGGSGETHTGTEHSLRVQVIAYGESDSEADKLRRAVADVFLLTNRYCGADGVMIHHINASGGPIPLVDRDIVWPAVSQAFTVLADLEDVA